MIPAHMGCRRFLPLFLTAWGRIPLAHNTRRHRDLDLNHTDKPSVAFLLVWMFSAAVVSGASLRQMDLEGLVQNADQIFRARVVSVTRGSVQAGGGTIPTLTYEVQIVDAFKSRTNGITRITMVTSPTEDPGTGVKRFPLFRDVPRLEPGRDYVLFVTRPSPLGLSTTVGLGQGCFDVLLQDSKEIAVNGFNNAGLGFAPPAGPVGYGELSAAIHSHLSR